MFFTLGCSDDQDYGTIDNNQLNGTWIFNKVNRKIVPENEQFVIIFNKDIQKFCSISEQDRDSTF